MTEALAEIQDVADTQEIGQIESTPPEPEVTETEVQVDDIQKEDGQVETTKEVTAEEIASWDKDKRYGELWGKDPNKMYDSLKFLEGKQGEWEQSRNTLTENKTQIDELQNYQKTVQEIMSHPELGESISKVIHEFENKNLRSKYGDSLSDDQLRSIQDNQQRTEELETKFKNLEDQTRIDSIKAEAMIQLDSIEKTADKYGLTWDEGGKDNFLEYCQRESVPVNFMHRVFQSMIIPQILDQTKANSEKTTQKNIESNKAASLSGTNQGKEKNTTKEGSWEVEVKAALGLT